MCGEPSPTIGTPSVELHGTRLPLFIVVEEGAGEHSIQGELYEESRMPSAGDLSKGCRPVPSAFGGPGLRLVGGHDHDARRGGTSWPKLPELGSHGWKLIRRC